MRPASFQVTFKDLDSSTQALEKNVAIEFLPCQFQNNIETSNKDIYFDPIIRPTTVEGNVLKEVSLQGRKMVGRDLEVPTGYKGVILGKMHQQTGYLSIDGLSGTERVDFEAVAEFSKVTEWKKDAWTKERAYASNVLDYLDCARIIHCDD